MSHIQVIQNQDDGSDDSPSQCNKYDPEQVKQKQKKKVVFLSSTHHLKDKRVYDKEAVALANNGFDVIHVGRGISDCDEEHKEIKLISHAQYDDVQHTIVYRLRRLGRLFSLAKSLKADVYHCNELDSWFIGIALKFSIGSKVIFDVHEHYPHLFVEERLPKFLKFLQPVIVFMLRCGFSILSIPTDAIVLAKRSVGKDFPFINKKKLAVLNYTPLKKVSALEINKKPDKEVLRCIHLGGYSKRRGWPQLVDAYKLISNKSDFQFEFLGANHDPDPKTMGEILDKEGFNDNFSFYEWMPFEQAFAHITEADVGLVLFQPGSMNHTYALPHKMFDYMLAGLAVIIPDFALEIAPIIKDYNCGILVDTSKPEEIFEALLYLKENPHERIAMGQRGRKAVIEQYNWEVESQKLVNRYNELLSQ